jgi:hypothetical protein
MGCHKSDDTLRHSHPLFTGPGNWRWVQENWFFLQNGGVITPDPDSLTILKLNPDLTYSVGGSQPAPSGYYKSDTTNEGNPGIPVIDSFYTFDRTITLGAGAALPLQRLRHWISGDTLYLQTMITPAGGSTYIFARYN